MSTQVSSFLVFVLLLVLAKVAYRIFCCSQRKESQDSVLYGTQPSDRHRARLLQSTRQLACQHENTSLPAWRPRAYLARFGHRPVHGRRCLRRICLAHARASLDPWRACGMMAMLIDLSTPLAAQVSGRKTAMLYSKIFVTTLLAGQAHTACGLYVPQTNRANDSVIRSMEFYPSAVSCRRCQQLTRHAIWSKMDPPRPSFRLLALVPSIHRCVCAAPQQQPYEDFVCNDKAGEAR